MGVRRITFDRTEVWDALAVWEELLDRRRSESRADADLNNLWDNAGFAEMRDIAIELSERITSAWRALETTPNNPLDRLSFDWEFVPALLNYVRWQHVDIYTPGYRLACAQTLKARYLLEHGWNKGE